MHRPPRGSLLAFLVLLGSTFVRWPAFAQEAPRVVDKETTVPTVISRADGLAVQFRSGPVFVGARVPKVSFPLTNERDAAIDGRVDAEWVRIGDICLRQTGHERTVESVRLSDIIRGAANCTAGTTSISGR